MNVSACLPRPPVERPSVWIGAELAKRPEEWSYRLSSAALAEIEAAIATVTARNLDVTGNVSTDWNVPAKPLRVLLAHSRDRAA